MVEYFFNGSATNFRERVRSSKHIGLPLILIQMLSEYVAQLVAEYNKFFNVCLWNPVLFLLLLDSQHIIKCESARKQGFVKLFVIVVWIICALNALNCLDELFVSDEIIILKFMRNYLNAIGGRSLLRLWYFGPICTISNCLLLVF